MFLNECYLTIDKLKDIRSKNVKKKGASLNSTALAHKQIMKKLPYQLCSQSQKSKPKTE